MLVNSSPPQSPRETLLFEQKTNNTEDDLPYFITITKEKGRLKAIDVQNQDDSDSKSSEKEKIHATCECTKKHAILIFEKIRDYDLIHSKKDPFLKEYNEFLHRKKGTFEEFLKNNRPFLQDYDQFLDETYTKFDPFAKIVLASNLGIKNRGDTRYCAGLTEEKINNHPPAFKLLRLSSDVKKCSLALYQLSFVAQPNNKQKIIYLKQNNAKLKEQATEFLQKSEKSKDDLPQYIGILKHGNGRLKVDKNGQYKFIDPQKYLIENYDSDSTDLENGSICQFGKKPNEKFIKICELDEIHDENDHFIKIILASNNSLSEKNRSKMRYYAGLIADEKGDHQSALKWFQLSGDAGNCLALYRLGFLAKNKENNLPVTPIEYFHFANTLTNEGSAKKQLIEEALEFEEKLIEAAYESKKESISIKREKK